MTETLSCRRGPRGTLAALLAHRGPGVLRAAGAPFLRAVWQATPPVDRAAVLARLAWEARGGAVRGDAYAQQLHRAARAHRGCGPFTVRARPQHERHIELHAAFALLAAGARRGEARA
ncbi:hypothetical protein [Streptomyces boncukensis]|uniref:Uncharacterized protein n=1 Tax=Streptomyces boncukensis TaxID=2711219 RepID=A0A6G4WNY1_9ACTN|nr:hypothetical protein [Streptomyces boncukensis]NGO66969.1 hypothetical protein [Streptomyces boncukensis]